MVICKDTHVVIDLNSAESMLLKDLLREANATATVLGVPVGAVSHGFVV